MLPKKNKKEKKVVLPTSVSKSAAFSVCCRNLFPSPKGAGRTVFVKIFYIFT
jgi:hypothetical protein